MTTNALSGKKFFHTSEPDFIYKLGEADGDFIGVEYIEEGEQNSIPFKVSTLQSHIDSGLWVIIEDSNEAVFDL